MLVRSTVEWKIALDTLSPDDLIAVEIGSTKPSLYVMTADEVLNGLLAMKAA